MRAGDLVQYIGQPNGLELYGRMQFRGPQEMGDPRWLECITCPGSSHACSYWFEAHELCACQPVAA